MDITRRDFLLAGVASVSAAVVSFGYKVTEAASPVKISQALIIGSKNIMGTNFSDAAAVSKILQ